MTEKEIIYISRACPFSVYNELSQKPNIAAMKFNLTIINSFAKYGKVNSFYVFDKSFEQKKVITKGNVDYYCVPIMSKIKRVIFLLKELIKIFIRRKTNCILICDILCMSDSFIAVIISKLFNWSSIGIVTDLPEYLNTFNSNTTKSLKYRIRRKMDYLYIKLFKFHVLLTEQMSNKIKLKKQNKYIVIEGFADFSYFDNINVKKNNQILYAGSLHKEYGIDILIKAFKKSKDKLPSNTKLVIYGDGNYINEIKKLCDDDKSIVYKGVADIYTILEEECRSRLLVNPRPINNGIEGYDFTKYSFPSKNIEYMCSGTPLLATVLPGMPKEYENYIYGMKESTVDELSRNMVKILNLSDSELNKKGSMAKEFMRQNKTSDCQVKKIILKFKL